MPACPPGDNPTGSSTQQIPEEALPQDHRSRYNRSKCIVCLEALPQDQAITPTARTAYGCLNLGNKGKRAAITNSFGSGARHSLGSIKAMQRAGFLRRQLCLLPRTQPHALSISLAASPQKPNTCQPHPAGGTRAAVPAMAPPSATQA